jgi:hypothetical protein
MVDALVHHSLLMYLLIHDRCMYVGKAQVL